VSVDLTQLIRSFALMALIKNLGHHTERESRTHAQAQSRRLVVDFCSLSSQWVRVSASAGCSPRAWEGVIDAFPGSVVAVER
jgi:hypothetical protein